MTEEIKGASAAEGPSAKHDGTTAEMTFAQRTELVDDRKEKRYGWTVSWTARLQLDHDTRDTGWAACVGLREIETELCARLSRELGHTITYQQYGAPRGLGLHTWVQDRAMPLSLNRNNVLISVSVFVASERPGATPKNPDDVLEKLTAYRGEKATTLVRRVFEQAIAAGLASARLTIVREDVARRANYAWNWLIRTATKLAMQRPIVPDSSSVPYEKWVARLQEHVRAGVPACCVAATNLARAELSGEDMPTPRDAAAFLVATRRFEIDGAGAKAVDESLFTSPFLSSGREPEPFTAADFADYTEA